MLCVLLVENSLTLFRLTKESLGLVQITVILLAGNLSVRSVSYVVCLGFTLLKYQRNTVLM